MAKDLPNGHNPPLTNVQVLNDVGLVLADSIRVITSSPAVASSSPEVLAVLARATDRMTESMWWINTAKAKAEFERGPNAVPSLSKK